MACVAAWWGSGPELEDADGRRGYLKERISPPAKISPQRSPVMLIIHLFVLGNRKRAKLDSSWLVRSSSCVCSTKVRQDCVQYIKTTAGGLLLTPADIASRFDSRASVNVASPVSPSEPSVK